MMERAGRLFAEYAEFQRGRPDLPQGDPLELSEEELEISWPNFNATGRLKQTILIQFQRRRGLCSIDIGWLRWLISAGTRRESIHRRRVDPSSSKV
jgi:hypothetical protein